VRRAKKAEFVGANCRTWGDRARVAVDSGESEKLGFVVPAKDSSQSKVVPASDLRTADADGGRVATATGTPPKGTQAVIHGHIDTTMALYSPGDSKPVLESGLPNGVVSKGRVAVYELVGGQLQIRMLKGSMSARESGVLQNQINKDQQNEEQKHK